MAAELAGVDAKRIPSAALTVQPSAVSVQWDDAAEHECRTHIRRVKAMDRLGCPFCTAPLDWLATSGLDHACLRCHRSFSDKVGTIFEYSKLPLSAWFEAVRLLTDEAGSTSASLGRALAVTQTSAWYLLNTLKTAAASQSFRAGARRAGPQPRESPVPTRAVIEAAINHSPARLPMTFGAALNGFIRTLPQDLKKPRRRADRGRRRKAC